MEIAVFLLFAFLALVSALVVVVHRNPVYSVMSLVVTLISTAVLFVLLGAPFLAALQVLVYTGAILVLFLFVIMLLNVERETHAADGRWGQKLAALTSAAIFAAILGSLSLRAYAGQFLSARSPVANAVAVRLNRGATLGCTTPSIRARPLSVPSANRKKWLGTS